MTCDQIPDEVVAAALRADHEEGIRDGRSYHQVAEHQVRRLIAGAVAVYENAVSWHTSCLACAALLDSGYAEFLRREQAEEKLAAVRALAEQLGDRTGEPALPAPEVKLHLPLSDRRIVEPIRRMLLEILDGKP